MPLKLIMYCESDGVCPLLKFLDLIPAKAVNKCYVKLERLQELGHKLRRPDADYLRDDIYELRVGLNGVNYRLLYFFQGKDIVILSHGITKERIVPNREIELAIKRMKQFAQDPENHTYKE